MKPRDYARARTDKIIAERFDSSSMSNAKWVRLLNALTDESASLPRAQITRWCSLAPIGKCSAGRCERNRDLPNGCAQGPRD